MGGQVKRQEVLTLNDEIEQLLENVDGDTETARKTKELPEKAQKYYVHGELFAICITWENEIHPFALYFAVYEKNAQDETLNLKILHHIRQKALKSNKDRLITRDFAPQGYFNCWLQTQNFKLVRTTVEPQIATKNVHVQNEKIQFQTAHQVKQNSYLLKQLVSKCYARYKQVHMINPVASMSRERWQKIIFQDQIDSAPLITIKKNEILAYEFLFEDATNLVTLGWNGQNVSGELNKLQNIQFQWIKERYEFIGGEFDSTDELAIETSKNWKFPKEKRYETFLKML